MKRTIKFRGKDVFTETWRYGDLVHNQKVTATGLEPRTMVGGYEVIPETVGQFTGFFDMDNNEVYEDDLVESTKDKRGVHYCVVFLDGSFNLRRPNCKTYIPFMYQTDNHGRFLYLRVKGNIHAV
mgnify:CR=1 FL=1